MAVYTEVAFDEAARLVQGLGLGELKDLQGIRSGIENTNYYALSTRGQWVLTLFERLGREQLPYYLELMRHLAQRGIPVPAPQPDSGGTLLHTLAGKPAALVTRLPGSHRLAPGVGHARQVGEMLGRMHVAGMDFPGNQPHLRGLEWWLRTVPDVLPHLQAPTARLLSEELAWQGRVAASPEAAALPRGPIHADLFRDNVMFDETAGEDRLCGFFDFYFAGTDALLFDVAVCLNDWCIDHATGRLVEELASPFLEAYGQARPLLPVELALLPAMLRAASFRFWLSRLWDWHLPRSATMLQAKDPAHFERVLRDRIDHPWHPRTA
jgi:homoserine kinase type II